MATDIQVYFCDPQNPWQRGSNESTNGLLRQYFPKGLDLSNYSQTELDAVTSRLNERPRKTLNYETPAQRYQQAVASTSLNPHPGADGPGFSATVVLVPLLAWVQRKSLEVSKGDHLSDPYAFFEKVQETIQELVIKKDRNPQKPINHHFVPRSFQQRFGGPDSALFAYIFKSKQIRPNAQPSRIGSVPHLYTLPNDDGSPDVKIEHFFGILEDRSAPVIEKVIKRVPLTEEERFWLCFFWGAAFCRSHHMIRSARRFLGDLHSHDLRQRYSSLDKTRHLLEQEPPEDSSVTAEELFNFVHSDEYEAVYETHSALPIVLDLIPEISQILWESRIVVLKAPENKSFVTGDNPVVLLAMDQRRSLGFGLPGVARVMPLSWDTCLISYSPGRGVINAIADREQVRQINLAIAADAHEFILGKSQKLIESLVDATRSRNRVWESSFTVSV